MSRSDYACFGDVLAFDATYRKNAYNMPLVVFSGVNHHFSTCLFGSALLKNEKTDNYKWVLKTLMEAMDGKAPKSVITDGDTAMKNAIIDVFPDANRRLCLWHLKKHVGDHVKSSKFASTFIEGFWDIGIADLSEAQFEIKWKSLVESCELSNNKWVNTDLYNNRAQWAQAFLQGKIFAGVRTTSRCEGFNSQLGKYVTRKQNLSKFFKHYHLWIDALRAKELELDFHSNYGLPEILNGDFQSLLRSIAELFTVEAFEEIEKEMKKSSTCIKDDCETVTENVRVYNVKMYSDTNRRFTVTYNSAPDDESITCTCFKLENMGLPCCHVMFVLKEETLREFPAFLVKHRWSKNPKSPECWKKNQSGMNEEQQYKLRYGILQQATRKIFHYGALTSDAYDHAVSGMKPIIDALELMSKNIVPQHTGTVHTEFQGLKNPKQGKPKGDGNKRKGQQRACTKCNALGHKITTCKAVFPEDGVVANQGDEGEANQRDASNYTHQSHNGEEDDDDNEPGDDDIGPSYAPPTNTNEEVKSNILS
ncbi:Protein FAR1-RELATED SEQUENCE 5 [Linum grandiflorum]